MKYAYYPGCSLHSTANEYDLSTRAVCKALDIELEEIPDWNCCGATSAHSLSHELAIALPLRNLARAEEMGLDVVAPCAACFSRLKCADTVAKTDPERMHAISEKFGIHYSGKVNVFSLLQVISRYSAEEIKSHVKRRLSGLRIAAYYGCLLLRPPKVAGFDDPENPVSMDRILAALGAEVVEWPYKNECCGASLSISKSDIVIKLTRDILSMAKRAGANCISTACPLCQGNLDMRQPDIQKRYGENYQMPIFYFTQLMGLAFGLWEGNLGLKKLMVSPDAVLSEMGTE